MITDKEMLDLGFKKIKTYKKTNTGVSSFCWEKYGMTLSIEKDLGSDFDCNFVPTLRIGFAVWYFHDIINLKKVLKSLEISC